jgi:hypothetical protein
LGYAKFAVTWLPVKNTQGIFMQGFKSCAWRDWTPDEKKSRPPKVMPNSLKNGELTPIALTKSEAESPPKSEHIELVPIYTGNAAKRLRKRYTSPILISHQTTADRSTDSLRFVSASCADALRTN